MVLRAGLNTFGYSIDVWSSKVELDLRLLRKLVFAHRRFGAKPQVYCISTLIEWNFCELAENCVVAIIRGQWILCSFKLSKDLEAIKKKRKFLRKSVTDTLKLIDEALSQQDNNARVQVLKDNITGDDVHNVGRFRNRSRM